MQDFRDKHTYTKNASKSHWIWNWPMPIWGPDLCWYCTALLSKGLSQSNRQWHKHWRLDRRATDLSSRLQPLVGQRRQVVELTDFTAVRLLGTGLFSLCGRHHGHQTTTCRPKPTTTIAAHTAHPLWNGALLSATCPTPRPTSPSSSPIPPSSSSPPSPRSSLSIQSRRTRSSPLLAGGGLIMVLVVGWWG